MSNEVLLAQLIKTALTDQNNNTRAEAQSSIIKYKDSNPTDFFFNSSSILQSQKYDDFIRQSAGTVAARLISQKNMNSGKYFWDEINFQQKVAIKQKILNVLISPSASVMKSGASVIASIASIDLPRGQWQSIIEVLAQNCSNNDPKIKNASITTLGFICEQIKKIGQRINDRLSEQILGSIIVGTRQTEANIIETSIKALENSLCFLETMMEHSMYRDAVFEVFINNFKNNMFIKQTYQALFEFVKAASPFLGMYRKALTDLTEAHLQKRDQDSIFNLEMWDIIGNEYADKMARIRDRVVDQKKQQNFLQAVSEQILPNIMKCLLVMNKKQQSNDDFKLSASRALQAFVRVCDRNVIDNISNSVASIINSEDPYHQQATVPLFSTICQYSDKDYVLNIFKNGFQHLFGLLKSKNKIVVRNSLMGFVRLSEAFPEVFLCHPNIADITALIFDFLNVDLPEIRSFSIQILANISQGLRYNPQPVSDDPSILLTKTVNFYTEKKQIFNSQQTQINQKLTMIIMNVIMTTSKRDVMVHLIDFMIDEYYKVANISIENSFNIVGAVVGIIQTAVLSHTKAIPSNDLLLRICDLMSYHFKKFGVESQGLSLLGATCTTFNKQFESRIPYYWPTVQSAITNCNDATTFKAGLACIGDFARVMEAGFLNYASLVMKKLLENIKQSCYERDVKLSIIICIGDLILSMQSSAESYLDSIIPIIDICFTAVYQLSNSDQDADYVEDLKSSLIQLYSCLTFAINSVNRPSRKLFEHFGNLATFIVRTCDKSVHPTLTYLKNSLYCLYDLSAFYSANPQMREKTQQIIGSNEVQQLSKILVKYNSDPQIKQLLRIIQLKKKK